MKRWSAVFLVVLTGIVFFILPVADSMAQPDIEKHAACPYCGMDRAKFAHARIYIEYDDGTTQGFCSLHCAAVDMAVNIDKAPTLIQVGDYNTKMLLDSQKSVWVLGGDRMGVMTKRAKWAFEDQTGAQAFVEKHGGQIVDFETAAKAAYEDMYEDTRMIREKRMMKRNKQQ